MSSITERVLDLITNHYDPSHPGYSQALLLLDSLQTLTQEKAQTSIQNIPNACVYFYSFIRSSLLTEQDTRKLFSLSTLLLFLLKDSTKQKEQSLLGIVQTDEQVEKRLLELLVRRKEKLRPGVTLEVEIGLLFLAVLKTKSKKSWNDFTKSKIRLNWLFKLATHNKKVLRKNSLAFLKQLLLNSSSPSITNNIQNSLGIL